MNSSIEFMVLEFIRPNENPVSLALEVHRLIQRLCRMNNNLLMRHLLAFNLEFEVFELYIIPLFFIRLIFLIHLLKLYQTLAIVLI